MMRKLLIACFTLFLSASAQAASTSYQATLGSGAAFATWCIGGSGPACTGGVFWPSTVIANSSGTELFTSGNPGFVSVASGAAVDGWSVTDGSKTDVPCTLPASATGCSKVAIQKAIANAANGPPLLGSASNGITPKTLAALSNTAIAVKAAAGQVYRGQCSNTDTTHWAYIQIFNVAAASVTMGSTAPADFVGIPPGTNTGFTFSIVGEQYSTAISAGAASTATGGTAPTTAIDCVVAYN